MDIFIDIQLHMYTIRSMKMSLQNFSTKQIVIFGIILAIIGAIFIIVPTIKGIGGYYDDDRDGRYEDRSRYASSQVSEVYNSKQSSYIPYFQYVRTGSLNVAVSNVDDIISSIRELVDGEGGEIISIGISSGRDTYNKYRGYKRNDYDYKDKREMRSGFVTISVPDSSFDYVRAQLINISDRVLYDFQGVGRPVYFQSEEEEEVEDPVDSVFSVSIEERKIKGGESLTFKGGVVKILKVIGHIVIKSLIVFVVFVGLLIALIPAIIAWYLLVRILMGLCARMRRGKMSGGTKTMKKKSVRVTRRK